MDELSKDAHSHFMQGNLFVAKDLCATILKQEPDHAAAFNKLGVLACLNKEYNAGISFFEPPSPKGEGFLLQRSD